MLKMNTMKKILLLIITMVPLLIIAQTPISPGPVAGTWNLAGSPYMVNGEIYIDQSASLTIEPGVEVRFTGWYKFIVNGSLIAGGTESANILFTANDTNIRWHGIRFIETEVFSILDYCIVEYGLTVLDETNYPDNAGGGILILNSPDASITLSNTDIQHNQAWYGGGLECDNANPVIDNCNITDNTANTGGGIELYSPCNPIVMNSTIAYNNAEIWGGGIEVSGQCFPEITGNTFIYNSSLHGGGIQMSNCINGFVIEGNLIAYNSSDEHGGGIKINNSFEFNIKQNLIAHNTSMYGGGVSFYDSDGFFTNNTIAYNEALSDGGGIYYNTGYPSFNSDIIYFNLVNGAPNQACIENIFGIAAFTHCDIQDSTAGFSGPGGINFSGPYINCIDGDPLFADVLNDNFNITWENYPHPDITRSPCIDAGSPGLPEPDGTINDIGAYPFFQLLEIPEALEALNISYSSFNAVWTTAYGALGYHLDVALDDAFSNMVYENIEIEEDTNYLVDDLDEGITYYYRVNSYNTALTSIYSNTQSANTLSVSVEEFDNDNIEIYSSHHKLFVNTNQIITSPGEIWIFNTVGQLLSRKQIYSGSNTIDPEVTDQIIIVKVIIQGKVYNKKLLIN